ncbi:MAG TPA: response regulator [bacterium]|nr:response regulator [bacterium]HPS30546.1 response regulator [bacterium]
MRNEKILIVEDELQIATLVKDYLLASGFVAKIENNGNKVTDIVKTEKPDLILLDIMLPGKDGITILKEIRQFSDIPVIILTARIDEIDRLIGLDAGADDYICKPFSPREVVARVKSLFRRTQKSFHDVQIKVGDIILDTSRRFLIIASKEISITPTEFNILKVMMPHPERVFTRSELLELAMGYDYEGYDRAIDSHMKNLRKKIEKTVPGRIVIESIYGTGYRFNS